MTAQQLVSDIVPALHGIETGAKVLNWMEILRVSHLPIVAKDDEFVGLISDNDILDSNKTDERIDALSRSLMKPYVFNYQHIYDVIEVASRLKLTVIPVLNEDKKYLGVITLTDLLHNFSMLTAAHQSGSIVILNISEKDYSLSEISRIVEGNNAKILSAYVLRQSLTTDLEVTLKIDSLDPEAILQTFYRLNFNVKTFYSATEENNSIYQKRYDELITYLNL